MKVVYIAGPYRADTAWKLEQNVRRAEEFALEFAKHGIMPICVHSQSRFYYGECEESFWLEGDLEVMRRCDAVAFITGYQDSSGSIGELREAKDIGLPHYHLCYLDEVPRVAAQILG